ncbi:MBL fold metallo-hydrolase, partial [Patulibacter sp. S7RM1-6]
MTHPVCVACGAHFPDAPAPPARCPICEDPRQYVPESGQAWTTPEALSADHRLVVRDDRGLPGVGVEPSFAIGQRALLVPWGTTNLLWDCVPLLDDAGAAEIERRGGLGAVAISHPHFYGAMAAWAARFDCPVLVHAADRAWITRPDPAVVPWDGDRRDLGGGLTLLRLGGHFPGGTVLHRAPTDDCPGELLSGDIVQVIPDRRHVSFLWSYPNDVPLAPADVERIGAALEPWPFDVIRGGWWDAVVAADGHGAVRRSVARYGPATRGAYP